VVAWLRQGDLTLVLRDQNGDWGLPGGRIGAEEFGKEGLRAALAQKLKRQVGFMADEPLAEARLLALSQWARRPRKSEVLDDLQALVVHFAVAAPDGWQPVLTAEHDFARWVQDPAKILPAGLVPESPNDARKAGNYMGTL
jgi:ADP-ribose pyrophosphatase YjhB (NUDIX family)